MLIKINIRGRACQPFFSQIEKNNEIFPPQIKKGFAREAFLKLFQFKSPTEKAYWSLSSGNIGVVITGRLRGATYALAVRLVTAARR